MAGKKKRTKEFDRPLAIAVEGIDFLHLLRQGKYDPGESGVYWRYNFFERTGSSGSGSDLKRWLRSFLTAASEHGEKFKPRSLLIVRDAEDDAQLQFESITKQLKDVGLPIPSSRGQVITGDFKVQQDSYLIPNFRVGVFLVPAGEESGCIENSLLDSLKVDYASQASEQFLATCVEKISEDKGLAKKLNCKPAGGRARWEAKVKVRAMIAAGLDDPGQHLGPSSNWLWDFDGDGLRDLCDFIDTEIQHVTTFHLNEA